jgi:prepilin-type N-terminal cleavage/methylation domain-containing protein
MQNFFKNKKGFTLIELLVVIAIIGVLSSIVISSLAKARESSQIATNIANLKMLRDAVESYYAEYGVYPDATGGWRGNGSCWGTSAVNWMPQLVSSGYAKLPLPQAEGWIGNCSGPLFIYTSNGSEYKLLSHQDRYTLQAIAKYPSLRDPRRPTHAIGFWSAGGGSF